MKQTKKNEKNHFPPLPFVPQESTSSPKGRSYKKINRRTLGNVPERNKQKRAKKNTFLPYLSSQKSISSFGSIPTKKI
jgi:hypothetical protein